MKIKTINRVFLDKEHYFLYLEKPQDFEFKPGQFLAVIANINNEKVKRFYSIASLPKEDFILLYIKRVSNGKMSNYLAEVPTGSKIEIEGPFGRFTLDRSKYNKIIFIASGTGIAPVRPLVYEALEKGKEVTVIHQERYEKLLAFKEEFEKLSIRYIPVLSREESTKYWKGHVQDYLNEIFDPEADYYIVGNPNFVKNLYQKLKEKGAKNIIVESF